MGYDQAADRFQDECGVFGIYSQDLEWQPAAVVYQALFALQHRGQDSAGIATFDGKRISVAKDKGLVSDVFTEAQVRDLQGHIAVGHVRYANTDDDMAINALPLLGGFRRGEMAVATNGSLVNAKKLRAMFENLGHAFTTRSDSEILMKLIALYAEAGISRAVWETARAIKGAYSLAMIVGDKLVGMRDPYGMRPLCLGRLGEGSYLIASETCAFDSVGGEFIRDVEPGEIVIIDSDGLQSMRTGEGGKLWPCSFEYVYFSRPDSVFDGISVHGTRKKAGEILWQEHPAEADVVVGVPDSGLDAAMGYAEASGIPYDIGFIKNKYIGRSFILPGQKARERAVLIKLNPLRDTVSGKSVVLVDDSIVRGTTSRQLIHILRAAGAKEIHMRIPSPPVVFPCHLGMDTPSREYLIGAQMSVDEMCDYFGADSLGFISREGLHEAICHKKNYCFGCFDGCYPVAEEGEE